MSDENLIDLGKDLEYLLLNNITSFERDYIKMFYLKE